MHALCLPVRDCLLDHPALAALDEAHQQRYVVALDGAHLFERLRGVELGGEQIPIRLLQPLQPLRRKALAFKTDLVNTEGPVFAPARSEREGQHVLSDDGSAADERVRADDAMLVYRAKRAQRYVVFNRHVTGERG